jgi:hypothetical protein
MLQGKSRIAGAVVVVEEAYTLLPCEAASVPRALMRLSAAAGDLSWPYMQ